MTNFILVLYYDKHMGWYLMDDQIGITLMVSYLGPGFNGCLNGWFRRPMGVDETAVNVDANMGLC